MTVHTAGPSVSGVTCQHLYVPFSGKADRAWPDKDNRASSNTISSLRQEILDLASTGSIVGTRAVQPERKIRKKERAGK